VASYQGTMQIKMKTLEKVDDSKVDIANFIQSSPRDIEDMINELKAVAAGISNVHLKQLMNAFLSDKPFLEVFRRTPAAKTLHHNYIGGLLEHVLELISLCKEVARHFSAIDVDLLVTGAFLHDIGKVRELSVRKSIEYTTEGKLIGHISLGYEMLLAKIRSLPRFPEETAMLLKHIMLSHHGEYEFGSPKRPKIQEAVVIHYLDDLSAKVNNFQATLKKENIGEGEWTGFNKMHERYLYRQIAQSLSSGVPAGDVEDAENGTVDIKGPGHSCGGTRNSAAGGPSGKLPLDI
jgi:3'-5' exoribonuclease